MCDVLRVSRSGFYDWSRRQSSALKEQRDYKIKRLMEDIYKGSRNTYGSPRIHEMLKTLKVKISVNRVAKLMADMDVFRKKKKRFKVITTNSKHAEPVAENRVDQNFTATKPNEIWLSDLTYVGTDEGWLYLVTVMDMYSRKIIGWSFSDTLEGHYTRKALEMAYNAENKPTGVIFHSDRGIQYACKEFRAQLRSYNFIQSMSRKGNCYDNAPMESFFHTLKTEFIYRTNFQLIEQGKSEIFEWIECFYNRKRIHSSIGYKTPVAMMEDYMLTAA